MAVTITIKGKDRDTKQPFLAFGGELSEYFAKLGFQYLRELSQKDPYDDFALGRDFLKGVKVDLNAVLVASRDRSIAPPPSVVGLEEDEEQFGWNGLVDFAEAFIRLIDSAEKTGAQVIWIGD